MKFKNFEEIIAWQKGQDLAVEIYKHFGNSKDWGYKDQICRAAVSISNNIAEGFDLQSNKQFVNFLYIARGSAAEVRSMLYLAERLEKTDPLITGQLKDKAAEISRILYGLIKSIDTKT
jgi:four helix bundle protein